MKEDFDLSGLIRAGIRSARPYVPGKPISEVQRELGIGSIIKLASNENPEPPLPAVVEAISAALSDLNRYPDAACFNLTHALARHLNVAPESLILGNGSNEVIDLLIRGLVSPGENVVFSEHSFIVYGIGTQIHFQTGVAVPLGPDDRHDLRGMAAAINAKTKLVIVCNPNNPTGTYNTAAEFAAFISAVPSEVIVAVDEAYYEYVTAPDYPQTLPLLRTHPNLVILRTFSKIHSLAGLRVGYGIGHPSLMAELHKTREPFNVNSLAQVAAVACLMNWDEVALRRHRNRIELEQMSVGLTDLGLVVTPSQTNFLLVRSEMKAGVLTEELLQRGVIVRPMHAFGLGDGALRVSIGLPAENRRCLAAFAEILG